MKKQVVTQAQMNNRANQLNPNNEAYWKSRFGKDQKKYDKQAKTTTVNSRNKKESAWKVEYKYYGDASNNYFADKLQAIKFINELQRKCGYTDVKLLKCYF